jgi:CMP/dCMP kinase
MRCLTVGGLPGTGTTTLCRLLQARLGLRYVYAGRLFRDEAARRGMDLRSFGKLCQEDPSVDQALDETQVQLLKEGNIILEGRLAGWLAHQNDVPALKVWMTCEENERLRRIVERDGGTIEEQRSQTREREASEADRYQRYYGADLADRSVYDLVLDSTRQGPDALADAVVAAFGARID